VTSSARVFVNGTPLDVPRGATTLDAVRQWDAAVADAVGRGMGVITDSRGLATQPDAPVQAGAIFRVIPVRPSRTASPGGGEEP
jgi:hypothetical protein